jgi:hypothetical protein
MISPSKINRFYTCQYSFECRYINKKPTIKTPDSSSFGSMVHDIIPMYYESIDKKITKKEIPQKIEECFVEGSDWRLGRRKGSLKEVQNNFKNFEFWRVDKNIGLPIFTETKLKGYIFGDGYPEVEGIIDAYWEGFWVDWKTGKVEEMDESRMIQGKIYEMLLKHNGYKVEKGLFINLIRGIRNTLPNKSDEWVKNKVRYLMDIMEKGEYKTKPSGLCDGWCEYALSCQLREKNLWKVGRWI